MTARQAKKLACYHTSLLIDCTICAGWDIGNLPEVQSEDDEKRVYAALIELEEELMNRGRDWDA